MARWTLVGVAALCACSDYDFKPLDPVDGTPEETGLTEPPVTTDGPQPDILVDPDSLMFEGVCEVTESFLVVSNKGDADLELRSVTLVGDGWTAPVETAPPVLAPLEFWRVDLASEGGAAELVIESNDPDSPTVSVPLEALRDLTPPAVSIFDPNLDDILPIDALVTLTGQVDDNVTPAEDLAIEWSSDASGFIGSASAAPDGSLTQPWAGERPPGEQVITVTATDACGNVGTATVDVCQQAGFDVESLDIATWNFEGSAQWDAKNTWVELTRPITNQAGTAFQTSSTVDSDDIEIEFAFFAGASDGADGFSLTALDSTRMTGFVGDTGGGLGYAGMPGWTIEVDTWYNAEYNDPTQQDHVSIHVDGNVSSYTAWAALPEMEDNNWHTMSVTVSGVHFTVVIDGTTYVDVDVPAASTTFPAYIGFTAATGAVTNYHLIDALRVTELVCEEPPK